LVGGITTLVAFVPYGGVTYQVVQVTAVASQLRKDIASYEDCFNAVPLASKRNLETLQLHPTQVGGSLMLRHRWQATIGKGELNVHSRPKCGRRQVEIRTESTPSDGLFTGWEINYPIEATFVLMYDALASKQLG